MKIDDFDSYISQKILFGGMCGKCAIQIGGDYGYLYMCIQHVDFDFSSVFQKLSVNEIHLILMLLGIHLKCT